MSLNLFFMYCAASSCWAGLQATISEHLRTSSGPRGRQQRPQPAGQMQHSPGNVWSSSVRVGDKIKESGVNLTWKKNEIEIIATIYLNSFKKSRQPNAITYLGLFCDFENNGTLTLYILAEINLLIRTHVLLQSCPYSLFLSFLFTFYRTFLQ